MRALLRGLGVSTFPWGRVTDTGEKKLPLPVHNWKVEGRVVLRLRLVLPLTTITEETPSGVSIRLAQENEELNNWTSVSLYSAVIADV
ncbi:hypothetical protein CDL15_Pgr026194 [Punica granatum]|uniref:Uncharacterized protein n=1 Tax=Punica granatum TaxID=22663 RepID=A0A218VSF5_PUNGR|nr:hypothetical protein CDL15_Pgr026194 [Punica granatum]